MRKKDETYSADEVLIEEMAVKKPKKRSWFSRKPKEEEFSAGDDVYYGIESKSFSDHTKGYEYTGEISIEDGKFERLFDTSAVSINKEEQENYNRIAKERRRRVATAAETAGVDVKEVEDEFGVAAPMPVTSLAADPYTKQHGISSPDQGEDDYQKAMMHTAELEKMQVKLNVLNDTMEIKKDLIVPEVDNDTIKDIRTKAKEVPLAPQKKVETPKGLTKEQILLQSQDTVQIKKIVVPDEEDIKPITTKSQDIKEQFFDDMHSVKHEHNREANDTVYQPEEYEPENQSQVEEYELGEEYKPEEYEVSEEYNQEEYEAGEEYNHEEYEAGEEYEPEEYEKGEEYEPKQEQVIPQEKTNDDFENLESNSVEGATSDNPVEVEKAKFIANFQKTGEVHKPINSQNQDTMFDLKIPTQNDGQIPTVQDIRDYRDKTLPLHIVNIDILQSVIAKEAVLFAPQTKQENVSVTIPKSFVAKATSQENSDTKNNVEEQKIEVRNEKDVQAIINSRLSSASIGLFVSGVLFIVMFFSNIILANLLNDENTLRNQLTPHLVIALVSLLTLFLVNHKSLIKGFVKLIKFTPNGDSAISLAFFATIMQTVFAFSFSDVMLSRSTGLYAVVVILAMFLNYVGKLIMLRKTASNYKFIKSKEQKYSINIYDDYNNSLKLASDAVTGVPVIAYQKKTAEIKRFWEISSKPDPVVTSGQSLVPMSFLASLVICLISIFIYKNIYMGINVFTACVCSSLAIGNMISSNAPLSRICRKTRKAGAMIAGFSAISKFSNINSIMIDSSDLFPSGTVVLDGIKTYGGGDKEQDMNFAAALLSEIGGTLGDVIKQITNDNDNDLPRVTNMAYEAEHGVIASVEGRKVLVGDKNLLMNHQIELPPAQDINEFKSGGKRLIYVSIDSKLRFIFILNYKADKRKRAELKKLEAAGIAIIARSTDPNLTQKLISKLFGISPYSINIITDSLGEAYQELVSKETKTVDAYLLTKGRVESIMTAVSECVTQRKTLSVIVAVQCIGVTIALVSAMLFSFTSAIGGLTAFMIMTYQIIWLFISLVITKIKKS